MVFMCLKLFYSLIICHLLTFQSDCIGNLLRLILFVIFAMTFLGQNCAQQRMLAFSAPYSHDSKCKNLSSNILQTSTISFSTKLCCFFVPTSHYVYLVYINNGIYFLAVIFSVLMLLCTLSNHDTNSVDGSQLHLISCSLLILLTLLKRRSYFFNCITMHLSGHFWFRCSQNIVVSIFNIHLFILLK